MAGQMPVQHALSDYYTQVRRTIDVDASPEQVYTAIMTVDLGQSRFLRMLTPAGGRARRWDAGTTALDRPPFRLTDVRRYEAMILSDEPGEGITLGAIARLWSVRPSLQRVPPGYFAVAHHPGFVKVTATIEAEPCDAGRTRVVFDVRFQPLDAGALRHFRMGWPFGRLITSCVQREVLSLIARQAELLAQRTTSDG